MRGAVRGENGDFAHPTHDAIHPPEEQEQPLLHGEGVLAWAQAGSSPAQKHLLAGLELLSARGWANSAIRDLSGFLPKIPT